MKYSKDIRINVCQYKDFFLPKITLHNPLEKTLEVLRFKVAH